MRAPPRKGLRAARAGRGLGPPEPPQQEGAQCQGRGGDSDGDDDQLQQLRRDGRHRSAGHSSAVRRPLSAAATAG